MCVKEGTIVESTSQSSLNNIEILRAILKGLPVSITSVYKPPDKPFRLPSTVYTYQ